MNKDVDETNESTSTAQAGESATSPLGQPGFRVDARGAAAIQVGEGNTQINYSYTRDSLWSDHVAPPPLIGISGAVESPYRGLGAFEEQDAPFFYGREVATAELMGRLDQAAKSTGLVVVSGVSGAGKSSLLRAGVLPRIRGTGLPAAPGPGRWECLLIVPTRFPLDDLAVGMAALAGTGRSRPAGWGSTRRRRTAPPPMRPAGCRTGPPGRRPRCGRPG